jgi:hypothetical protein
MIIVFDPTPKKKGKQTLETPRLSTLKGQNIAVIWNGKLGGDIFLNRISELLTERFGVAGIERIDDRGDKEGVGVDQLVINRLAKTCNAVVLGTGD